VKVISRAHHRFPAVIYGHVSRFSRARRGARMGTQSGAQRSIGVYIVATQRSIMPPAGLPRRAAPRRGDASAETPTNAGAPAARGKGPRKVNKEGRGAGREEGNGRAQHEGAERREREEGTEGRQLCCRRRPSPPPSLPALEVSVL